jgi:hypothetical protein
LGTVLDLHAGVSRKTAVSPGEPQGGGAAL